VNASERNRRPARRLSALLCFVAAVSALAGAADAQAPPTGGLGTASDYVVGFVQYVRWPAEDDIKSWQVCVAAPLADKANAFAGRSARGKPFEVRAVAARDAIAECHVLDLSDASAADAKALLERARRLAILTVGEGERFCTAGGVACLRRSDGGGFEINLSAAQQARLNVNAQLLMLGRKRQIAGDGS
jgi:YfiR/HmsC-like